MCFEILKDFFYKLTQKNDNVKNNENAVVKFILEQDNRISLERIPSVHKSKGCGCVLL